MQLKSPILIPHVFKKLSSYAKVFLVVSIFALGIATGFVLFADKALNIVSEQPQKDEKYLLFLGEIYDKILENYWETISEEQLAQMYRQTVERLVGTPQKLDANGSATEPNSGSQTQTQPNPVTGFAPSLNLQGSSVEDLKIMAGDKEGGNFKKALYVMLAKVLRNLNEDKKQEFSVKLAANILSSLSPAGRSGLFTQREEQQLKNTVENINPDKDLYADLGLVKGASEEEAEEAYQQKIDQLEGDESDEAKAELDRIAYAREVLTEEDTKQNYDAKGVEPTVSEEIVSPDIAYIKFDKFSPTTYDEFVKTITSFDNPEGPSALIFDLRGNIGGAIDALPFFLGNFLGDKQYIYDFLQRGEYQPYRSIGNKLPGINRLKQVVILVDGNTQSSAELMAASLKRYRFGVLMGTPTKGWGTVEKVFQLENQIDEEEKYSMFLVHSITLRDDNQPIEGRGVEPDININDANWEQKLSDYFRYPELTSAVKRVI